MSIKIKLAQRKVAEQTPVVPEARFPGVNRAMFGEQNYADAARQSQHLGNIATSLIKRFQARQKLKDSLFADSQYSNFQDEQEKFFFDETPTEIDLGNNQKMEVPKGELLRKGIATKDASFRYNQFVLGNIDRWTQNIKNKEDRDRIKQKIINNYIGHRGNVSKHEYKEEQNYLISNIKSMMAKDDNEAYMAVTPKESKFYLESKIDKTRKLNDLQYISGNAAKQREQEEALTTMTNILDGAKEVDSSGDLENKLLDSNKSYLNRRDYDTLKRKIKEDIPKREKTRVALQDAVKLTTTSKLISAFSKGEKMDKRSLEILARDNQAYDWAIKALIENMEAPVVQPEETNYLDSVSNILNDKQMKELEFFGDKARNILAVSDEKSRLKLLSSLIKDNSKGKLSKEKLKLLTDISYNYNNDDNKRKRASNALNTLDSYFENTGIGKNSQAAGEARISLMQSLKQGQEPEVAVDNLLNQEKTKQLNSNEKDNILSGQFLDDFSKSTNDTITINVEGMTDNIYQYLLKSGTEENEAAQTVQDIMKSTEGVTDRLDFMNKLNDSINEKIPSFKYNSNFNIQVKKEQARKDIIDMIGSDKSKAMAEFRASHPYIYELLATVQESGVASANFIDGLLIGIPAELLRQYGYKIPEAKTGAGKALSGLASLGGFIKGGAGIIAGHTVGRLLQAERVLKGLDKAGKVGRFIFGVGASAANLGVMNSIMSPETNLYDYKARIKDFLTGAKTGAVFGSFGLIDSVNFPNLTKALRMAANSAYTTIPSHRAGQSIEEQAFQFALGLYFGSGDGFLSREKKNKIAQINSKRLGIVKELLKLKEQTKKEKDKNAIDSLISILPPVDEQSLKDLQNRNNIVKDDNGNIIDNKTITNVNPQEIPEFKNSEEAIKFGEKASSQQKARMDLEIKDIDKQLGVLNKENNQSETINKPLEQKISDLIARKQFLNEAINSKGDEGGTPEGAKLPPKEPKGGGGNKKEEYKTAEEFDNIPVIKYARERLADKKNKLTVSERDKIAEQMVEQGLMSIDDFNAMTGQFGFGGKVTGVKNITTGKPIPSKQIEGNIGEKLNYISQWQIFRNAIDFGHRNMILKDLSEGKHVPNKILEYYKGWTDGTGDTGWADRELFKRKYNDTFVLDRKEVNTAKEDRVILTVKDKKGKVLATENVLWNKESEGIKKIENKLDKFKEVETKNEQSLIEEAKKYKTPEEFVNKQLDNVAQSQRGKPESSRLPMFDISPAYGDLLEVSGDLIHRMYEDPKFFKGSYAYAKIKSLLFKLNDVKDIEDELYNAAKKKGISKEQINKILKNYANEYKKLPAYNETQQMAKDIPIAIAEGRYKDAKELVKKLDKLSKNKTEWEKAITQSQQLNDIWNKAHNNIENKKIEIRSTEEINKDLIDNLKIPSGASQGLDKNQKEFFVSKLIEARESLISKDPNLKDKYEGKIPVLSKNEIKALGGIDSNTRLYQSKKKRLEDLGLIKNGVITDLGQTTDILYKTGEVIGDDKKIVINIPDDGQFKILNNLSAINNMLNRLGISQEKSINKNKKNINKTKSNLTTRDVKETNKEFNEIAQEDAKHKYSREWPKSIAKVGNEFFAEVLNAFRKLGTKAKYHRLRMNLFGTFHPEKGARLKDITNILTSTHELGHNLDFILNNNSFKGKITDRINSDISNNKLKEELRNVSRVLRPDLWIKSKGSSYSNSNAELMADYISHYILDKEGVSKLAPNMTKGFEERLANNKEVSDIISSLQSKLSEGTKESVTKKLVNEKIKPNDNMLLNISNDTDVKKVVKDLGLQRNRVEAVKEREAKNMADRLDELVPDAKRQSDLVTIVEGSEKNSLTGKTKEEIEKSLTPKEEKAITLYRGLIEKLRQDVNEYLKNFGISEYIDFLDNYFIHAYDKGLSKKEKVAIGKWYKNSPNAKRRKIPTLEDAIKMGLIPRITTLSEGLRLWSGINNKIALNKAYLKLLPKITNEEGFPVIMKPKDAPANYVTVDYAPIRQYYVRTAGGKTVIITQGKVAVDPRIKPYLDSMFGTRVVHPIVQGFELLNATAKAMELTVGSFFHYQAELFSTIGALGNIRTIGGYWGKQAEALGAKKNKLGFYYMGILKAGKMLSENPTMVNDFLLAGGKIGRVHTEGINLVDNVLLNVEKNLKSRTGNTFANVLGIGVGGTERAYKFMQDLLWDNVSRMKLLSYYDTVSKEIAINDRKSAEKRLSVKQIKELSAQYVNNNFGGQEFENTIFKNPKLRQALSFGFMSLDWTYGQVATASHLFSFGGNTAEERAINAFRRKIGAKHFSRYITSIMVSSIVGNFIMSGHAPWDNEPGHKFDVDWTRVWRMQDELTHSIFGGKNWKERNDYSLHYIKLGKAGREVVGWVSHPIRTFGNKLGPVTSEINEQIFGHNIGNIFKTPWAEDTYLQSEHIWDRIHHITGRFVPFGLKGNNAFLTFPSSKGMTPYKAGVALEQIYHIRAMDDLGGIDKNLFGNIDKFFRIKDHLASGILYNEDKLVKDIKKAAEMNHVDFNRVNTAAKNRIRTVLYKGFADAYRKGDKNKIKKYRNALYKFGATNKSILRSLKSRGLIK